MIKKADVIERLNSLIGQEVTCRCLHEALFCEEKHSKILRRYNAGTYTYVQFKIHSESGESPYVDIKIPGNPATFRVGLEERDGKMFFQTAARISYSYQ